MAFVSQTMKKGATSWKMKIAPNFELVFLFWEHNYLPLSKFVIGYNPIWTNDKYNDDNESNTNIFPCFVSKWPYE